MNKVIFIILLIIVYLKNFIFYQYTGLFIDFNKNLININKLNVYHKIENFLTTKDCKEIKYKILKFKDKWLKRNPILYTLGNTSYISDHHNINTNEFMYKQFKNIYQKLIQKLKKILNTEKVFYKEDSYLPGFHIFPKSKLFSYNIASFHFDGQYSKNKWKNCSIKRSLSFTIPIDLPKDKSGLYMFNANYDISREKAMKTKKALIEYKIGKIVLHSGNNWHIMKSSIINKDEYRITLQGHLIDCGDRWLVYW